MILTVFFIWALRALVGVLLGEPLADAFSAANTYGLFALTVFTATHIKDVERRAQ